MTENTFRIYDSNDRSVTTRTNLEEAMVIAIDFAGIVVLGNRVIFDSIK